MFVASSEQVQTKVVAVKATAGKGKGS